MRNSEKQNLEKIEDLQDQDVYRMYTVEDRIYACLVFQKQIIVLRTQVMRYTGFFERELELESRDKGRHNSHDQ